ncbi:MAG: carbon starvation CstA family protein [Sarcina sp.]
MSSIVLLVGAIALFVIAYVTYGAFLAKKWGIDPKKITPAHRLEDNVDYVPTDSKVVLGHHFSSIAGAGPITGPIQAAIFGWIPVFLWIVIGSIFVGGVYDYSSLFASVRHDGKSIGEITKVSIGPRCKKLFNLFAWLALVLVLAAFTDICAGSFAYNPSNPTDLMGAQAGTASVLFIVLAMLFGFFVYRRGAKLSVASIIGVILLVTCIFVGMKYPIIQLTKGQWQIALSLYILFAANLPVWLLLQPRDYLCSFLLYGILIGAILGIFLTNPTMELAGFNGFVVEGKTLFPILFVTVACGAISGFHSLVSSGTTAKQINSEKDIKLVGYGSMLVEGLVAVIALIAVGSMIKAEGTPAVVFANGVAGFMKSFGIPVEIGRLFVTLSFSAFALTSLDTATRIARYIFQELCEGEDGKENIVTKNGYVATGITIAGSLALILYGYDKIWPIFGASNQLLAALAFLAVTAWLSKRKKQTIYTLVPMILMFVISISALVMLAKDNLLIPEPNYILGILALILLVLAVILIIEAAKVFKNNKKEVIENK